jgi:hypothetical protein
MADEKRAHDFDCALGLVGFVGAALSGEKVSNPYRAADGSPRPPRGTADLTEREKKAETREFLFTIETGLRNMVTGRGNV